MSSGRLTHAAIRALDWLAKRTLPADEGPQHQHTGRHGEEDAYFFLRRRGYVMVARNFRCRGMKGEIDLVGYDGGTVAFVEVKTRTSSARAFGSPEDAVSAEKRRHLARMARHFLLEYHAEKAPFRFDILAIESPPGRRPVVRLHKAAFAV